MPESSSARPDETRSSRSGVARVPRSTIALLLVSVLVPLILFALAAVENRHDVERAADHRVERTLRILHEHALKVFETQQLLIDQLNERLRSFDWQNRQAVGELQKRLAHIRALLPQVASIIITDPQGRLRASSFKGDVNPVPSFADRDFFQALQAADLSAPYVSHAGTDRFSKQPVFNVAARLKGPIAEEFYGVIAVAIDKSSFMDFYRDDEHDNDHLVILARQDGGVLASEPVTRLVDLPPDAMLDLARETRANGLTTSLSEMDGVKRIFGFEKVGAYPVVIGFGITASSALAPWWRNMWGYGLVAALSSLALLGVSGVAIRRIVLEGRATVRWRKSAALLKTEMAERAEIEEQLRQAQKMEAVGRLTGGIAHDFNNLLTVVIGSLDLLSRRMKDADPRQKALIGNAVDGATKAAALTARLLAFSRQHPLDPEAIDAGTLINGMSNLLQRTLGETVSIECRLADDLWSTYADPNQLENAILNLCVNAVDAMDRGGVLTVETANVVLDEAFCGSHAGLAVGDYVVVGVTDTGVGMPPEVVARAFEPFFTTKPVGKGTGLGLSQVYGFARQSGGHADIRSEQGVGTTIKIYLPRLRHQQASRARVAPSIVMPARSPSRGTKILLVEDDDLVRQFSASALREAGYIVVEGGTGPDALMALRHHDDIALLFTDIVLKGPMNGRDLADQVAIAQPELPVLFTTGYTKDAITHQNGLADGINFIGKPFTTAALTAKIAALLSATVEAAEIAYPADERRRAAE